MSAALFAGVLKKPVKNAYCQTKSNRFRKQIPRQLVLRDRFFDYGGSGFQPRIAFIPKVQIAAGSHSHNPNLEHLKIATQSYC